jgi:hypothetical protein
MANAMILGYSKNPRLGFTLKYRLLQILAIKEYKSFTKMQNFQKRKQRRIRSQN